MAHHARPRRGPFAMVLAISVAIHLVVALIFGTIKIVQYVRPPEAQFETPPPPAERIEPQKLEYKVRMQERQADSAKPTAQRITVATVSDLNPPSLDAVVPALAGVGVNLSGSGRGQRGGLGSGLGSGGIGFGVSAVNFFGIKSRGERVVFLVDVTPYMLEDEKGGVPAFRVVKEEIERQVRGLSPGTLFNLAAMKYTRTQAFRPAMVPASDANKQAVRGWLDSLNAFPGELPSTTELAKPIEPMGHRSRHWPRGVQVAAQMGADAIFMIVPQWQFFPVFASEDEEAQWRRSQGWSESDEAEWMAAWRRAQDWLNRENDARKARGQPPRVVNWLGDIIREQEPGVKRRPHPPAFEPNDLEQQVRNIIREHYPPSGGPVVNVVLFFGRNERRPQDVAMFEGVVRPTRGRVEVLQGFDALRNVLTPPPAAAPKP